MEATKSTYPYSPRWNYDEMADRLRFGVEFLNFFFFFFFGKDLQINFFSPFSF